MFAVTAVRVALQPPSTPTSGPARPLPSCLSTVRQSCQLALPQPLLFSASAQPPPWAVLCYGPASLGDAILAPSAPAHEVGDSFLLTLLSLELPP